MTLEILNSAPDASAFTPLEEHQSQTPGTFFGGKPVLHLHSTNAQLLVSARDLEAQSAFPDLRATIPTNGAQANGDAADEQLAIPGIDVWVTSQRLILFSAAKASGVAIPYPAISLHALQRLTPPAADTPVQGLYMQLLTGDTTYSNAEEDFASLELTLVPAAAQPTTTTVPATSDILSPTPPAQALFTAVSACADLNPDPVDSEDEDEDTDPFAAPMPGAGGWITAENVDQFTDENGNFTGDFGALGAGAGTVRAREEDDAAEERGEDAQGGESEETKWRRTE
ncbi:uncharacterized protein K452DRAFT_252932 [Aplosporella prunicola CBS 121167]|uniref:Regulator of volume decrease after cellular swelling-domain-containing protein n=1 Tax=Aplosporella prunicola CBS 121167 TaxID=1176127 RepID=A0A6A6B7W6_9PEZI|nr:uncharacterized protein K452DRAFT_252932 [Aplosporella prunicola CBS 121167]KAF2140229.1 hypothetical protein K452DRAFT_252932 [Aplosporella prunicola CBS 121167]